MQQAAFVTPRRPRPCAATDRRRESAALKAKAESFIKSPADLRTVLNGARVRLDDHDLVARLSSVRAVEITRREQTVTDLFIDDIDAALIAARWARRRRRQ